MNNYGDEISPPLDDHKVFLDAVTALSTLEGGGAMLAIITDKTRNSKGNEEERHSHGHSCQELPSTLPIHGRSGNTKQVLRLVG